MANDYYQHSSYDIPLGSRARSQQVDDIGNAIEDAFDLLPSIADIYNGKVNWGTDSGAANAYVVTTSKGMTAHSAGCAVAFLPTNANTGAAQITVDGLATKDIKQADGTPLGAGELDTGNPVILVYNGTNFMLVAGSTAVTKSYIDAAVAAGGDPGLINFQQLSIGSANALETVRVNAAGDALEGYDATATTTAKGLVELADSDETITGTDTDRAVTPAGLQAKVASTSAKGIVQLATGTETIDGVEAAKAVTPAALQTKLASETAKGLVELATTEQAAAGTLTNVVVTPAGLKAGIDAYRFGVFPQVKSAEYTALKADNGAHFICTGTWNLYLTAAATLVNGWHCYVENNGTGVITIDPNSTPTIDGAASVTINPGQIRLVGCDGANFYTIDLSPGGWVHLGTAIVSEASAIVVDEFSSTYDEYRIVLAVINDDSSSDLRMRAKIGGAYKDDVEYNYRYFTWSGTEYSALNVSTSFYLGESYTTSVNYVTLHLYDPLGSSSGLRYSGENNLALSSERMLLTGAYYDTLGAATAVQLYPASGTLSGTLRVYGLSKAMD